MDENISIVDLILTENIFNRFLVQFCQCFCAVQFHTSKLGLCYVDVRWISIQSDTNLVQFTCYFYSLLLSLAGIQYHQHHIGIFCDSDNLSTSALTVSGSFDNTWQI
jgi:hypothetical protein